MEGTRNIPVHFLASQKTVTGNRTKFFLGGHRLRGCNHEVLRYILGLRINQDYFVKKWLGVPTVVCQSFFQESLAKTMMKNICDMVIVNHPV